MTINNHRLAGRQAFLDDGKPAVRRPGLDRPRLDRVIVTDHESEPAALTRDDRLRRNHDGVPPHRQGQSGVDELTWPETLVTIREEAFE
ncbi:MAG: hypothetical protein L0206_05765, partial [Actinobacteria bacterium]|nr:hypothetical protein [Actinomycetota bacterium]